jgi:reactive chlorine resistance protein C
MNTRVAARTEFPAAHTFGSTRARALESVGTQVLRYGLVLILVLFGLTKFTAAEAAAIKPLVSNSPLMSWLYGVLSDQGASALIGTIEIATAILIASRPLSARVSALGSALAVGTFLTTLSFLFTTPGALAATHPAHGFLLKDIVLLAAAFATGTEALRSATEESEARASS